MGRYAKIQRPESLFNRLMCISTAKFSMAFCFRLLIITIVTGLLLVSSKSSFTQLPTDPNVIHGNAAIDTIGGHMSVTNSPNTIINWQDFSIGNGNSVHFQQPDVSSQILNRVIGSDPSQILGNLSSNGGVWLINPHGVLFGEHARINVGALVASTIDISNLDFLGGRYHFNATENGVGSLINQGEIRTSLGGRVWMTGEQVRNEGLIESAQGSIVLAAGKSIELVDSGVPNVTVRVSAPENEAVNLGTMVTDNGQVDVHGSIVNQHGIIRADRATIDESGKIVLKATETMMLAENSQTRAGNGVIQLEADTINHRGDINGSDITMTADEILQEGEVTAPGGEITMQAERLIYLDGQIDASNAQGTGGNVHLETGKLEGMAGGTLRADGEQGGHIRIEGRDSVAFSSTLEADGDGQGGKIEVTGDSVVLLNADLDASGGAQGGTVHLGGGWQGKGDLAHAREVIIGAGSEVKANGNEDGGEIAVWSTQNSEHYGLLQAKEGGRIELSSRGMIHYAGDIQAGLSGEVLFDPKNLVITDNPPDSLTMARKLYSRSVNGKPELASGDNFGASLAMDGDHLVIGATGDDTGGYNRGAVHLFSGMETDNFDGLTWQKKVASDLGASGMDTLKDSDLFGVSVALDGDHLAIGAQGSIINEGNPGAVYLFNGVGTDFSGLALQKTISSERNITGMPPLTDFDFFGTALALDGDRLIVGAAGDSSLGSNRGAVHMFTDVGTNFSELKYAGKLASGSGANNMRTLADSDFFGWSLALDGDRMLVGALNDSISNNNRGAVHLFTNVGEDFSGLTWENKIASGAGANKMPILSGTDFFGWSLALEDNQLAVGAFGDDTAGSHRGSVYLFTFNDGKDGFSDLHLRKKIVSGDGAVDMPILADGDGFGWSLALNDNRLAVGTSNDHGGDSIVYLFNGLSELGDSITDAIFTSNPSITSYIRPDDIASLLNTGTAVTLQANNDITVTSAVNVNADGLGGNLILQAGRNITFNAEINSDNGNLTAIAGDEEASIAFRDSGTPTLSIAKNVSLNIGAGMATLAAINGDFINNNGDSAIINEQGGRWLIYAANQSSSREGFTSTSFDRLFNQSFSREVIPEQASNGNWFFYNASSPAAETATVDGSVQNVNVSRTGTEPLVNDFAGGGVFDVTPARASIFSRLDLASMDKEDMRRIVEYRKEFKNYIFAEAIYKLELDPSLSDVPVCASLDEIDSGSCKISAKQRKEYKSIIKQQTYKDLDKTIIANLPQIERKLVILFGIDQYTDNKIPALENTIYDVEKIGKLFVEELGYEEARIVRNATREEIIKTLNNIAIEVEEHDSVVIYYAGHGYLNEKTGSGYWIPSDATATDPTSWISNESITEMLSVITSNQMIMLSDSCYSGAFTMEQKLGKSDIKEETVDDILTKRTSVVMSSGGDEPVADEGREGHSIFAWFLIQSLKNVENWKPGSNIFEQVQRQVRKSFPQTPQYGAMMSAGHEMGGDYLFEFRGLKETP